MQAHPASAAVARIATSLNVINGQSYPADLPVSECAWIAMCQCGPMDPNGLCARNLQPIELELTDRSSEGHYLPPASAGPTRQHDAAVRRRRNQADDEGSNGDSASSHGWTGGHREAHRYPYGTGGGGGGGSEGGKIATWFTEIGRAIEAGVSQTVAKVKEAANQPVLARPSSGPIGYGAAADAMLAGRRKGPGSALGRAPFAGGMTSAGGSSGALTSQVMGRGKQGGKDD
ncbi:hypothetical protein HYH03_009679 [Edaphochlamys debaryana]|uniref:Uncharacterized protein n=1 Tax=Edaphochlamys debaryana TaxID=47281 RepID=A0A835Y0Q2_9CHLO|nr:hypothetical protein HYH03_009679 [Edaphochlamys debaryana]|eukprot:KAG2491946.1 hypothetical protein HYH03_009679 [Edaphochlamys debaryana]